MTPHECTVEGCACTMHRWNGKSRVYQTDPPSTCTCGHRTAQHRFRVPA